MVLIDQIETRIVYINDTFTEMFGINGKDNALETTYGTSNGARDSGAISVWDESHKKLTREEKSKDKNDVIDKDISLMADSFEVLSKSGMYDTKETKEMKIEDIYF